MALLKRSDSNKIDFTLSDYLKLPQRLAAIFGYGNLPQSCSKIFRLIYALYSCFAVGILVYTLAHLLMEIEWDSKFDLPKAAIVLSIIWATQSLLSALFFIYITRRGGLREMKRCWLECGADELISASNFRRVKWRWLAAIVTFCLIILITQVIKIVLEYNGLTLETQLSKTPFIRPWQLCLLLPASIYCAMAFVVPIYTFYLVCQALSYAWLGFCEKIRKISEKTKSIGFGDESVHFVADTHLHLTKLTDTVSQVYGLYAFVMIILAVPELFLQLYFVATMPAEGYLKGQCFAWLIISFSAVFIFFSACTVNTSACQVAEVFYLHYYTEWRKKENESEITEKALSQTSILLTKLYNTQYIHISASGWFDVSKATLGAIMSCLVTGYFIFFLGGAPPENICPSFNATANSTQNSSVF